MISTEHSELSSEFISLGFWWEWATSHGSETRLDKHEAEHFSGFPEQRACSNLSRISSASHEAVTTRPCSCAPWWAPPSALWGLPRQRGTGPLRVLLGPYTAPRSFSDRGARILSILLWLPYYVCRAILGSLVISYWCLGWCCISYWCSGWSLTSVETGLQIWYC